MKKIKRSNGRGTKSLSKSLFNSIVFGKEIIMKKIKMKKRFGLNRQKSRAIVENVLSGTKAGFKSILNFEHAIERKKMDHQKSKSTFSATLLALILGLIVLWTGPAVAAEKKMVKDPTTGKMVTAPEYGGTITYVTKEEPSHTDVHLDLHAFGKGLVIEKLVNIDWAVDRAEVDFVSYTANPSYLRGSLAESWSQPDAKTIIVKVRQGVRWHDKAPMSGRELIADDIVYNFHRVTGTGSGFTEGSAFAWMLKTVPIESIEATDKYTVVFKLKQLNLGALGAILDGVVGFIYPPEVIKEHGDVSDWKNLVGTGPMMLTDWTRGSSVTYKKNPDYRGTDEKYPQNRLPYVDRIRALVMPEVATQLAALRSGKVDYMGVIGAAQMRTMDQVESLRKTNPEIELWEFATRSDNGWGMNIQIKPFDDIRVRKAMQMALNLEEIHRGFFKGFSDPEPQGRLGRSMTEVYTPFAEWPEEVKKRYTNDPEGAEVLLDEAGYPRGADGIRFKTVLTHLERYDVNWAQLCAAYWAKIGVEAEVKVLPLAPFAAARKARNFEMINAETANRTSLIWALPIMNVFQKDTPGNNANVNDPTYEAMLKAAAAATTREELYRRLKELDMYHIKQAWHIYGPLALQFSASQPWLKGYNGESTLGTNNSPLVFTRLWIDSELKQEMGH